MAQSKRMTQSGKGSELEGEIDEEEISLQESEVSRVQLSILDFDSRMAEVGRKAFGKSKHPGAPLPDGICPFPPHMIYHIDNSALLGKGSMGNILPACKLVRKLGDKQLSRTDKENHCESGLDLAIKAVYWNECPYSTEEKCFRENTSQPEMGSRKRRYSSFQHKCVLRSKIWIHGSKDLLLELLLDLLLELLLVLLLLLQLHVFYHVHV